ncbi:hypothetical protein [Streptomyces sp. NBC_00996]|uniref:hypothetical protein n=1 Tax=Streptomyces sp. NBC_00996 TaxID=2903710 RepID=UPI003863FDCB|nr:hypothetical protein OG390_17520 [Streptomyces sp. NBC_00996]
MSGETVLRIQPGESIEDFTNRIADTAPAAPPDVIDQLRDLLAIDAQAPAERAASRQPARAAA